VPSEKKVQFYSDGLRLAGVLFLPEDPGPHPGVVLCHGFTGIKEFILPEYACRFAAAGYAALTFDYRGFGESEGPRWRLIPWEQVTDIRQSSQVRALEVTVHSVQKMIKQEFFGHLERTKQRYKRIVIDSMTALKMFSMQGQDSRILIQSFLRFLSELEATSLIVSEHLDRRTLETEFFLSRGEIRLHKWLDGSMIRRAVSIEKFRGSPFDDRMRPVSITSKGMIVQLEAVAQSQAGSPGVQPRESLLEARIIDEVSNLIEAIMRGIDEAHRLQIPVRDIEVSLSRAMLHFQRRHYQKALKVALACDSELKQRIGTVPPPPPVTVPPRPPEVMR